MTPARPRGLHRFRRAFQVAFLLGFFTLLTLTVWPLGQVFLGVFLTGDPLIALNSALNGVLLPPMVIALVLLLSPLVVGRAFCGYVCPMGTIVELTSPRPAKGTNRLPDGVRGALRTVPVFVVVASAGLALFSVAAFLFLDPLSLLTRASTVLLYPLLDRMIRLAGDIAYLAPPLRPGVDAVTGLLSGRLVFAQPLAYAGAALVLAVFGGVIAASRLEPRLWCRHLCPLGALLGTVGRAAVAGRVVDAEACTRCGACARVCPLDAVGRDFHTTDTTRCQLGLECADACPANAIRVGVRPRKENYQPGRRALLGASAVALLAGFVTYTRLGREARAAELVRPPGARAENEFLGLCSRCGQCMKVCPTNVLQPSLSKAGLEGVFTPEMEYDVGPCDWACNECGKVCPTGAIRPLALETKRTTKIGRAYIDRNRCIPWADYKTCIVCQELCPVPKKAITLRQAEVVDPDGRKVKLQRPEVVVDRCIGCGVCENACPVQHRSAIEVRAR